MSKQFIENVWLSMVICANCGMVFAMTSDFERRRRDDNQSFYCPAGHSNVYRANQLDKIRDELARKERELLEKEVALADTKTRLAGIAKANTKMRARIVNGVCPCCNRTFQNLMRHMKTEHPDFSSNQGLRMLRTAFGLTQTDVAKEIGVNAPYVSNYERGGYVPERARRRIDGWVESHNAETAA